MKSFIIAILMLAAGCGPAFAQLSAPDTSVIRYPDFTVYYCSSTANAKVVYTLYKAKLLSAVKTPRPGGFHATGGRENFTRYYLRAHHDIGHYYSAKNGRYSKTTEYNTFDFVNTRPQNPLLNRYRYFPEENYERSEAVKYDSLKVVAWDTGSLGLLGGRLNIPQYCWKKLLYRDSTVVFRFPNVDSVMKHPWYWYRVK